MFQKLHNLKTVQPDGNWKKNCREILYSQISSGHAENKSESNLKIIWQSIMPREVLMNIAKPVWAFSLASVLILIIGVGGVYASKNSKPGDSLYIAKIISEKAQMAVTFNEKEKAKLGLRFAASRAREITQVLEEPEATADGQNKKVEQLSQNFKKEINQVKNKLTMIQAAENAPEEEQEVFGANLGKNGQKIEISESIPAVIQNEKTAVATSTEQSIITPDKALEEAEKLFDEKNYGGTINKIEEIKHIFESGKVEGASETATSTK